MADTVVDASGALAWILRTAAGPDRDDLDALLDRIVTGEDRAWVPDHFYSEVYSGLVRAIRNGKTTLRDAEDALSNLTAMPFEVAETTDLYLPSLSFIVAYDIPTRFRYDVPYLVLASSIAATLWTADRRFSDILTQEQRAIVRVLGIAPSPR